MAKTIRMPYKHHERQTEYQRHWMASRRQAVLDHFGNACQRCGNAERRLEIHHRNPAEKVSHKFYNWAWNRIYPELAKCELLCSDCHMTHTREFLREKALLQPRDPHGGFVRLPVIVPRIGPGVAVSHARREEITNVA